MNKTYKGVEGKSNNVSKGNAVAVKPHTAPPPPKQQSQSSKSRSSNTKNGK